MRLIPAGAGKTLLQSGNIANVAAHPRRCGENSVLSRLVEHTAGSSPQVRGKLLNR